MYLFRNQKISRRRAEIEIENQLLELKFRIENPAKYDKGEVLEDGTVISSVVKLEWPRNRLRTVLGEDLGDRFSGWTWVYEGVKDGKIITVI